MDKNCFIFWTTQLPFLFLNPRRIQMVLRDKSGIINETLKLTSSGTAARYLLEQNVTRSTGYQPLSSCGSMYIARLARNIR
jgi:hypothetical protein